MADRYPGYWQASDGHWYPDALMPPPPPDAQPVFVGPPPDDRPSSKGRGGLLVGAAFGAVLIGALGIARIPYEVWIKWFYKILIIFILLGFLLLLPTIYLHLNGF